MTTFLLRPTATVAHTVLYDEMLADAPAAVEFLETVMGRMKASKQDKPSAIEEAKIIFICEIGIRLLEQSQLDAVKEKIRECEKAIDSIPDTSDLTYSFFYKLSAAFHKSKESPADFYRSTLQYLTYTPIDTLSMDQQCEIARDLCLAAFVAEDLFTFGELIQHPVLGSLDNSEFSWMPGMLRALNIGNIAEYDKLCAAESAKINGFPIMVANQTLLRQKLSIAALIELIFQRNADERQIPFADIAEGTGLPLDQVEHLLIKALSLKLVRGVIDEVDQNVNITWAIPHALDMDQIATMKDKIGDWQEKTKGTMQFVEDESPELFT